MFAVGGVQLFAIQVWVPISKQPPAPPSVGVTVIVTESPGFNPDTV